MTQFTPGMLKAMEDIKSYPSELKRRIVEGREIPEATGWWDYQDGDEEDRVAHVTGKLGASRRRQ